MIASSVIIWSVTLILAAVALRRSKDTVAMAMRLGLSQGRVLILRMPLAILIGAFLVELIPQEAISSTIGVESGLKGILIASAAGALLPGGPYLSFPIAVAFYKAGVGAPQLIALITAWSTFALHRVFAFELPMMGARFMLLRLISSILFPPLAGILAALALNFISIT